MKTLERKISVDVQGLSKQEIKEMCDAEGYAKSTYYNILKRGYGKFTVVSK